MLLEIGINFSMDNAAHTINMGCINIRKDSEIKLSKRYTIQNITNITQHLLSILSTNCAEFLAAVSK